MFTATMDNMPNVIIQIILAILSNSFYTLRKHYHDIVKWLVFVFNRRVIVANISKLVVNEV